MKDKEYHVANLQLLFPKLLFFSPQKMDEFNFKLALYCINKIFKLTKSCIQAISKCMLLSGNWTSCRAILLWNHTCDYKSNLRCALVRFWNHAYDFNPNCTLLSSITITNNWLFWATDARFNYIFINNFLYFLIATESRPRLQTKKFAVSTLG